MPHKLKKSAVTCHLRWDGISHWVESKISNGILEGLNSVLQAAKRKARGYKEPKKKAEQNNLIRRKNGKFIIIAIYRSYHSCTAVDNYQSALVGKTLVHQVLLYVQKKIDDYFSGIEILPKF